MQHLFLLLLLLPHDFLDSLDCWLGNRCHGGLLLLLLTKRLRICLRFLICREDSHGIELALEVVLAKLFHTLTCLSRFPALFLLLPPHFLLLLLLLLWVRCPRHPQRRRFQNIKHLLWDFLPLHQRLKGHYLSVKALELLRSKANRLSRMMVLLTPLLKVVGWRNLNLASMWMRVTTRMTHRMTHRPATLTRACDRIPRRSPHAMRTSLLVVALHAMRHAPLHMVHLRANPARVVMRVGSQRRRTSRSLPHRHRSRYSWGRARNT